MSKFLFGDGVIIRYGFYVGCTGVVMQEKDGRYFVNGMQQTYMGMLEFSEWFDEDWLEEISAPY